MVCKCELDTITVTGDTIQRSKSIKYLGTWIGENLSFKEHIKRKCGIAMGHIQRLKRIKHFFFAQEAFVTVTVAVVIAHIDYANALFVRRSDVDIKKLHAVQNIAAKLVLGKAKYDSCAQCLRTLHWLSVKFRIIFKILTMVHKCLNSAAPQYLIDLLTEYTPKRDGLRSGGDTRRLVVLITKMKLLLPDPLVSKGANFGMPSHIALEL